ncbi:hypothetical protein ACHQM5_008154 [Ranunculus cassubicifolius]
MTQQLNLSSINTNSLCKYFYKEISMELGKLKMKRFTEFDTESSGSSASEDFDSPKSVWKNDLRDVHPVVHHQVLKIRAEDSHLGEDIRDKLVFVHLKSNLEAFFKENNNNNNHQQSNSELFFGKPMLPASPLSGRS